MGIDFESWLQEGKEFALNYHDNEEWVEIAEKLKSLGAKKLLVVPNESDYADTLLVVLPEENPMTLIAEIATLKADSVSVANENTLSLWWD